MNFTCTGCRAILKADDSLAGKRARCPKCGTVMSIPLPISEPATPKGCVSTMPPSRIADPLRQAAGTIGSGGIALSDSWWLNIDSLGYHGQYVQSKNGRFILSWADCELGGGRGGARASGEGTFILLDQGSLILRGRMPRPNDGLVSDVGVFAISDWGFSPSEATVFHVTSPTGDSLIRQRIRAGIASSGISDDGLFAVCQTYDSDCEAHSGKLWFFDVSKRVLSWRKPVVAGLAEGYEFDTANGVMYLCYPGSRKYRITFVGQFLDGEKARADLEEERLRNPNAYELFALAVRRLADLGPMAAEQGAYVEVESLLRRALEVHTDADAQARALEALPDLRGRRDEVGSFVTTDVTKSLADAGIEGHASASLDSQQWPANRVGNGGYDGTRHEAAESVKGEQMVQGGGLEPP